MNLEDYESDKSYLEDLLEQVEYLEDMMFGANMKIKDDSVEDIVKEFSDKLAHIKKTYLIVAQTLNADQLEEAELDADAEREHERQLHSDYYASRI